MTARTWSIAIGTAARYTSGRGGRDPRSGRAGRRRDRELLPQLEQARVAGIDREPGPELELRLIGVAHHLVGCREQDVGAGLVRVECACSFEPLERPVELAPAAGDDPEQQPGLVGLAGA